jgi:hypothetical protein
MANLDGPEKNWNEKTHQLETAYLAYLAIPGNMLVST